MVKVFLLGVSLTGNKSTVSMFKSAVQNLSSQFNNIFFKTPKELDEEVRKELLKLGYLRNE